MWGHDRSDYIAMKLLSGYFERVGNIAGPVSNSAGTDLSYPTAMILNTIIPLAIFNFSIYNDVADSCLKLTSPLRFAHRD
jgi:hypothetical protein